MTDVEKTLLEAVEKLGLQMTQLNLKVDKHGAELSQVQSKVTLAMDSLGALQQEQISVSKALKTQVPPKPGAGIIGPPPPPPPPLPNNQGNPSYTHSYSHGTSRFSDVDSDSDGKLRWTPKMDFPKFDGTDARIWLDKCTAYFAMFTIPPSFRVSAASLNMIGSAAHWFQSYKHSVGSMNWDQFVQAVISEFESDKHRTKMMELLALKQTGLVDEYKKQFESLVYHIRLFDSTLSDTLLVSQFLRGLKHEIRGVVELQLPENVAKAAILAQIQEKLLDTSKKPYTKYSTNKPAYASVKPDHTKQNFSSGDLWKAKQLKEYRRLNHLCFKCGAKYVPGHECSVSATGELNHMELTDGGGLISDELLDAIERSSWQPSECECHLSLNAVAGTQKHKSIQLRALIVNQILLILIDSASSHSFLNAAMLSRIKHTAVPAEPMQVKVANGATVFCDQEVEGLEWWLQGHTFKTDARILPLGAYDLVLGMDWLEQFSPMKCDWLLKWIEFNYQEKLVRLQGALPDPSQWNSCGDQTGHTQF